MFNDVTRRQLLNAMETVAKMKTYCVNSEDRNNMELIYAELKKEIFYRKDLFGYNSQSLDSVDDALRYEANNIEYDLC